MIYNLVAKGASAAMDARQQEMPEAHVIQAIVEGDPENHSADVIFVDEMIVGALK